MAADAELYRRGEATLLAAWDAYAAAAPGAAVVRLPGVAAGVFPRGPERDVYNNAVLARGLGSTARAAALDAMEEAYAAAGIVRYAAWVHESDARLRRDVEARGYRLEETTRAMAMELDALRVPRPTLDLGSPTLREHVRLIGLPDEFLRGADERAFHVLVACLDGEPVATAIAVDHEGDCGVFNVGTHAHARRRGLGTAITALALHDALARGCTTASLQSTPMGEGIYARVGFRDLGRILEFVP